VVARKRRRVLLSGHRGTPLSSGRLISFTVTTGYAAATSARLIAVITPSQCRMARAALQIGVRDLAEASGISAITITRFETGKSGAYESRRPVISRNVSTILRQALV